MPLIRERYDKLIFPLFDLLELVFYQEYTDNILNSALQIIEENKNLADGKLLEINYYLCTKTPSQEEFMQLCTYVDRMYDKFCRQLGLKMRSLYYRLLRHQYKHWFFVVFYELVGMFWGIAILLASYFLILGTFELLYEAEFDINPITTILLMFVLFSIIKFSKDNS